jgi:hypothetical protein
MDTIAVSALERIASALERGVEVLQHLDDALCCMADVPPGVETMVGLAVEIRDILRDNQ